MGEGKLTEHAQNLQGCKKCKLRNAVGNNLIALWVRITVIAKERLKTNFLLSYKYVIWVIVQEVLIIIILAQEGLINS